MITDKDIEKLKKVFATKDDLANIQKETDQKFEKWSTHVIKEVTGAIAFWVEKIERRTDKVEFKVNNLDIKVEEFSERMEKSDIKFKLYHSLIIENERKINRHDKKLFPEYYQ